MANKLCISTDRLAKIINVAAAKDDVLIVEKDESFDRYIADTEILAVEFLRDVVKDDDEMTGDRIAAAELLLAWTDGYQSCANCDCVDDDDPI